MKAQPKKQQQLQEPSPPSPAPQTLSWADVTALNDSNSIISHEDYGLDPATNLKLLDNGGDDKELEQLRTAWSWMNDMKTACHTSGGLSPSPDIDLSYVGIHTIWTSTQPSSPSLRLLSRITPPSASDIPAALSAIRTRHSLPTYPSHSTAVSTAHPSHRTICLALNQTSFTPTTLQSHITTNLLSQPTRGALYAYLHSSPSLALSTLAPHPTHSALAIALSASSNPQFSSTVSLAASSSQDPYTSSLLSHLSTTSWSHLLHHPLIPLRDKLLVALTTLSDSALTAYLSTTLTSTTTLGTLSALPLLGLTSLSTLPLLTAYISRTADLTTPTLLLAHSPLLSNDPRSTAWRHLFTASLVSSRHLTRLAAFTSGLSALQPSSPSAQRQTHVTLRCLRCDTPLSLPHTPPPASLPTAASSTLSLLDDAKSPATTTTSNSSNSKRPRRNGGGNQQNIGVPGRCGTCGASWPRCGVCRAVLGSGDQGLVHCLECGHGVHAVCAEEWFDGGGGGGEAGRVECSVPECGCECAS